MSSEPVWRALVKALSDFSSFFPPVSKLKPSFEGKDMHEMLVLCCKSIVTHPSAEMMLKIRKSKQAAQYLQVTCRNFPGHISVKPYLSTHNLCSGSSRHAIPHFPLLFQLQQTSLKALGRLMAVLLETEPTGGFFQSIVHVSMCGAREKARCLSIVGTGFWGLRGRSEGEKSPADVPAH